MEVPEKIYLNKNNKTLLDILSVKDTERIEYVRKDAFIKKAEEFIYSALNDGIMGTANIEDFMRLFKKYMKE